MPPRVSRQPAKTARPRNQQDREQVTFCLETENRSAPQPDTALLLPLNIRYPKGPLVTLALQRTNYVVRLVAIASSAPLQNLPAIYAPQRSRIRCEKLMGTVCVGQTLRSSSMMLREAQANCVSLQRIQPFGVPRTNIGASAGRRRHWSSAILTA